MDVTDPKEQEELRKFKKEVLDDPKMFEIDFDNSVENDEISLFNLCVDQRFWGNKIGFSIGITM